MKPPREAFDPDAVRDQELVAHLFGDTGDGEAIERALAASDDLRRRYQELRMTLELFEEEPVPERGDGYGAEVWSRIEHRLESRLESRLDPDRSAVVVPFRKSGTASSWPTWIGLAAAAVLLLAAGFLLGRLGTTPPPDDTTLAAAGDAEPLSQAGRERLLTAALADHLGRSERLLTELANASQRSVSDAELERLWASELLVANRLYRRAAEQAGQRRIAGLLAELEPVLLELAHVRPATGTGDDDEWHQLRRRVDERGLLLKVRVTERRLDSL